MRPFHARLWLVGAAVYATATLALMYAIFAPGDSRTASVEKSYYQTQVSKIQAKATTPDANTGSQAKASTPTPESAWEAEIAQVPISVPGSSIAHATPVIVTDWQANSVDAAPAEKAGLATSTRVERSVSIRTGPSTANPIIGTASAGSIVQVKGTEAGWVEITDLSSGQEGWIYSEYLSSRRGESKPPKLKPPTVKEAKVQPPLNSTLPKAVRTPRDLDRVMPSDSDEMFLVAPQRRLGLLPRFRERRGEQVVVNP